MVDWNKEIQHQDGSPAKYLGKSNYFPHYRVVTPPGKEYCQSGNHYNDDGTHAYGERLPIVNVTPAPTDQELADELRIVSKRECELFDILIGRGYKIENDLGQRLGSSPVTKIYKETNL